MLLSCTLVCCHAHTCCDVIVLARHQHAKLCWLSQCVGGLWVRGMLDAVSSNTLTHPTRTATDGGQMLCCAMSSKVVEGFDVLGVCCSCHLCTYIRQVVWACVSPVCVWVGA